MVSATYVPSQDVLEQQTMETANYSVLMELIIFCTSQFHCTQATAAVLSQDRDRPSLEGATLSLCKYASELAGYGVNSVIARSIFLFLYILQGRNHDETFVRRHMTT